VSCFEPCAGECASVPGACYGCSAGLSAWDCLAVPHTPAGCGLVRPPASESDPGHQPAPPPGCPAPSGGERASAYKHGCSAVRAAGVGQEVHSWRYPPSSYVARYRTPLSSEAAGRGRPPTPTAPRRGMVTGSLWTAGCRRTCRARSTGRAPLPKHLEMALLDVCSPLLLAGELVSVAGGVTHRTYVLFCTPLPSQLALLWLPCECRLLTASLVFAENRRHERERPLAGQGQAHAGTAAATWLTPLQERAWAVHRGRAGGRTPLRRARPGGQHRLPRRPRFPALALRAHAGVRGPTREPHPPALPAMCGGLAVSLLRPEAAAALEGLRRAGTAPVVDRPSCPWSS